MYIICFDPSPADVNSWLVTFGFQLYNVIPGYRKPSTEAMEPSYELVRTQIKTQEWDSTKVVILTYPTFHLTSDRFLLLPLSFPTSLANGQSLCSQTPKEAGSYQAKTSPGMLVASLVLILGNGVRLNSSCNCPAIRKIHSPFLLPLAIDFISALHC